ncbi:putative recombinase [Herbidospora sp. NBRC 101105]|nr:putative recombinase [Herbidospora sp. NBRC 101105]
MSEIRFGFYGRVSTEDNQDPASSRAWQITRSRALIESRGGGIVAEFFDVDKSRSIPWQRRPRAAALLTALRDRNRGFEAVVIGEPHRAFYGNQYGLTFPIFEHFGVPLWVPEVGGPIDPANEAHDLVMSVFGGMSKGERNRVKVRVRSAMGAQAKMEGRFLGGRPPYGYILVDAGPHPNPSKAADGRRLHRLELDPIASVVVARIFADYLTGYGLFAIAERLTRDGILSPSAHDRARNRHRSGIAWSKGAVRAILTNPRYTGYQVWNRQRKDEVLIDVDDVGLGHVSKLRWNPESNWIWSDQPAHPPIVSREDFEAVQLTMAGRGDRHTDKTVLRTRHVYQLRGLLVCGLCDRNMQGQWINETQYYRCRYPEEYALANRVEHPRNIYLREIDIASRLDRWLERLFSPSNINRTLDLLGEVEETPAPEVTEAENIRRQMAECDRKLARHRAALEAGADAALVAGWMGEEQKRKAALEHKLRHLPVPQRRTFDRDELAAALRDLGGLVDVLGRAEPTRKAKIYKELGLRLTYHPGQKKILVAAVSNQDSIGCRYVSEGGLEPPCPSLGTSTSS